MTVWRGQGKLERITGSPFQMNLFNPKKEIQKTGGAYIRGNYFAGLSIFKFLDKTGYVLL